VDVSGRVEPTQRHPGSELSEPVVAIPQSVDDGIEVGEKVDRHGRVADDVLIEREATPTGRCRLALERPVGGVVLVGSPGDPLDGVDQAVAVGRRERRRREERLADPDVDPDERVRRYPPQGPIEDGGESATVDRLALVGSRRPPSTGGSPERPGGGRLRTDGVERDPLAVARLPEPDPAGGRSLAPRGGRLAVVECAPLPDVDDRGVVDALPETGTVSGAIGPTVRGDAGAESPRPTATSASGASSPGSTPRRSATVASAKPAITAARRSNACAVARPFARTVPASRKARRYVRSRYFQSSCHRSEATTAVTGASATAGDPVAAASTPR